MPTVVINLKRIKKNIHTLQSLLKKFDCDFVFVTKSLNINKKISSYISHFSDVFYDTKHSNIEILLKYAKVLIHHQINENHHNQINIINSFEDFKLIKNQNVQYYINFDLGEGRGGFSLRDCPKIIKAITKAKYQKIVIMSNIGCFDSSVTIHDYLNNFIYLKKYFISHNISIDKISVGGSYCIPWLKLFYPTNLKLELRVGEAVLLGYIPGQNKETKFLKNNIKLVVDIIESHIDENKYLCNFGYIHLDKIDIQNNDWSIIKQSSERTLLYVKNRSIIKDNKLYLSLNYKCLAKLANNRDIVFEYNKR